MGFPHRRRLVTLLDVGVMPSGTGPPVEPPIEEIEGLGVWYKADQGVLAAPTAANFVAVNAEHLTIPTNTSLRLGNIPWTVGGWAWHDSAAIHVLATRCSGALEMEWQLYTNAGTVVGNNWNGATHGQVTGSGAVAGAWQFFILSYDPAGGGVMTVQVNNGTLTSAVLGAVMDHAGGGVMLGANTWGAPGAFLNGRLQNWFMFGRALDAADRSFLWNGGNGRYFEELPAAFKTGLRAWWPLDEISGSRRDLSGNNNTLTDNNTVMSAVGKVGSPAGVDGAPIQIWEDSGPNGLHVSQATALYQPTLQISERNGKPVVRFDGNDWLERAGVLGSLLCGVTDVTVFIVQSTLGSDTQSGLFGWQQGLATNQFTAYVYDSNLLLDVGAVPAGRLSVPVPLPWGDTWHLMEGVRAGSTGEWVIEGNLAGTGTPSSSLNGALTATWNVGQDSGASGIRLSGDVAELIIFSRALTATERDTVRDYLKLKWGIAQNKLVTTNAGYGYLNVNSTTNDRLAIN